MNTELGVLVAAALVALLVATLVPTANAILDSFQFTVRMRAAPTAISGNNVYTAWPNNDTGHWGVFFAKSTDGGKTLGKTMMLSAPNKGNIVNSNVDIAASGSNVVVTWWTNKTGTLMPVFKASNDNGDTFGKTIMLNSTSGP